MLVEDQKLDGVVKLPRGVFRPYAGVSTAILLFTKTNSGGTDHVWFYDCEADGLSLDDKRTPLLPTRSSARGAKTALSERRAREEQPARHRRPLAASATAPSASARAPRRASACPRPTSRRRLRPLAQPLQGSGARGGRAPPAEGDHRGAEGAGEGDCGRAGRVGGDAVNVHVARLTTFAKFTIGSKALADQDRFLLANGGTCSVRWLNSTSIEQREAGAVKKALDVLSRRGDILVS